MNGYSFKNLWARKLEILATMIANIVDIKISFLDPL